MIRICLFAAALAAAPSSGARAQDEDVLRAILEESAAKSPEVAQARAAVEVERARVPQAGALPDPSLALGIQNDGFTRINIGNGETSFFIIGLTQPLPWPGKRALREQVATLEQRRAEARLSRALLDVEARVRREWLGLSLVRGQLELLGEQEQLWVQAEQTARARYESGQAPQSDLFRAQLERARLEQRKWAREAELATRSAELNRLRSHPLGEPVQQQLSLAAVEEPRVPGDAEAQEDAEARSPELALARLTIEQSARRVDLAHKEELPDFAVSAAVMPRGALEPMWQLGFSIGLPVFEGRKQARAVEESEQRREGETQGAEALRQILRLRTAERLTVLAAFHRINEQYRSQLLILSAAAARSTLSQYEVGRVPFASALEALSGYVADRAAYLSSIAGAQLVAIAQREVSLEAAPSMSGDAAMPSVPGAGQAASGAAAAAAGTPSIRAEASASSRGMNGM